MRVAFYKAKYGNFVDLGIAWWTASFADKLNGKWKDGYSHTELVFSDNDMFSASSRDSLVGWRKFHPSEHWDVEFIAMSYQDEDKLRRECNKLAGAKYDYAGILGFVIGTPDASSRWFCSEVVTAMLQKVQVLTGLDPSKVSPNRMAAELRKRKK